MPVFMDRHYIEGASQHAAEMAHQQDMELQDEYGVAMLGFWFDEQRSTAFCLVDAPNEEALRELHLHSHGMIPNEIVAVDPTVADAFLGQIVNPIAAPAVKEVASPAAFEPAFRSIMFTDLKDSTQLAVQLGDEKAMHLLRVHNALTREAVRAHDGREVKTTGDGFLLSFAKARDALACAIEIQDAFASYNEQYPNEKLFVRIGVSAGEPIEEQGDLYGAAVNLAARLCSAADAGGVLVAQVFRDEIEGGIGQIRFTSSARLTFKGFDQPMDVYEVVWE